ncbi:MAG: TerB family tellurite resistance protein [Burkholderiales bacterium]|nr:TerB family tellurite resistance protein [Burkholderiales bacterium]
MLASLRELFEKAAGTTPDADDEEHAVAVAAAVLMLEVARSDDGVSAEERAATAAAVRTKFGLDAAEAERVIAIAEEEAREATGLYPFTSLINRELSAAQKERLLELVWRVAYADAELDAHELHLVRKIANLLHVPHATYVGTKLRARDAQAKPAGGKGRR